MRLTVRAAVLALALALSAGAARAGDPAEAGESPLAAVHRLREQGDIDGAAKSAAALAREAGATADVHVAYQDLLRDLGRDAEVEAEYKGRARAEGATADDLWLYARLLRGTKAVAQHRAALRLDPAHFRALCGLGNELLDAGDERGAEKAFQQAKSARPESGLPWNGLGRAAEANGDSVAAEAHYRKAVELSPTLVVARVNLAVLLLGTDRTKPALEVLDEAVKAFPRSPLPLVAKGMAALRESRGEDAAAAFEAAMKADPRSVAALNMLAGTYLNLQKLDLAEKAIDRALELNPRSAPAHVHRASLRLARGETAGAVEAAARAVQIDGESALAHFALGRAHDQAGDAKKAESGYRRAVKCDETSPVCVRGLAQFLGREDRWKDAAKLFQRVCELTGDSPGARYELALAHVGANEPKKAADTLEKLVEDHPDHLIAWLKLGILRRDRLRDEKRALAALRTYVEKGGKDARVKQWIAELEKGR